MKIKDKGTINSSKGKNKKVLIGAAIISAATAAAITAKKLNDKKKADKNSSFSIDYGNKQIYIIGGGIESLSAAVFLVRDCKLSGKNIHVIETSNNLGGNNYTCGDCEKGYFCPSIKLINKYIYKNFFELLNDIPSIEAVDKSVAEEIINFNNLHPTKAQGRLIDKECNVVDLSKMGLSIKDRITISKLLMADSDKIDNKTIENWFSKSSHFFNTNFWYLCETTFAFKKSTSLIEFKKYLDRIINEYNPFETLEWVCNTPYNEYESIILPIKEYLEKANVEFMYNSIVTNIKFKEDDKIIASEIDINNSGNERVIKLRDNDVCIMTAGSIKDKLTIGDYDNKALYDSYNPSLFGLWEKIATKKIGLGNPEPFYKNPKESTIESFTITSKGNTLLKEIEKITSNIPGSGSLMTFKDSNWLISINVPVQPYFKNQPLDTTVLWGYAINCSEDGNYINKPIKDCSGKEILEELMYHLNLNNKKEEIESEIINVIPCIMPYKSSALLQRKLIDRPEIVPEDSVNFAFIGDFVEIHEDGTNTLEYSVKSAKIAVYKLFDRPLSKVLYNKKLYRDPKAIKNFFKEINK